MMFFFYSVWYSLDYLVIFVILIATSKCGIQGSRISRPHLSLFTVYKRVLHIIKVTRYYIDMQIIVGICIKICSILLHYPFKFKSGGFRLHMKPSVKEQASYRPGWDGQRESCIVLLYVQSLDYPCLDST